MIRSVFAAAPSIQSENFIAFIELVYLTEMHRNKNLRTRHLTYRKQNLRVGFVFS